MPITPTLTVLACAPTPRDANASFAVEDVEAEYERLTALGVRFTQAPLAMGPVTTAVLDDTCGNLLQIAGQLVQSRLADGLVSSYTYEG